MNLQRAIEIALEAHKGALDKGGNPYILHPLRLMLQMDSEEEMIVAILHDVVEDSEKWSFDKLHKEGFSKKIINSLRSVTKENENEDYEKFIDRSVKDKIGRKVKIADISDNLDISRLKEVTDKDILRINKYKKALEKLKL
ncbi:MAG: hypothetical protein CFH34_00922 [Alphaproteobacteria bacterium MarineAlpha9_Bin4]|jgi:(p)ppGpp synthase/HD superfamily hydrolase|nr:MAG: hypothetical protein CFH34_00922 [Alphaproteobacteria bacterium MarineAlpha9_Bin4]|tara:strand:+ start:174 stop:596 length:423 start_codon:yes stop_codon:yes gene_type:complete